MDLIPVSIPLEITGSLIFIRLTGRLSSGSLWAETTQFPSDNTVIRIRDFQFRSEISLLMLTSKSILAGILISKAVAPLANLS